MAFEIFHCYPYSHRIIAINSHTCYCWFGNRFIGHHTNSRNTLCWILVVYLLHSLMDRNGHVRYENNTEFNGIHFELILVCCHRSRRCALYVFFVSILCAAAAITLIVLDALFIGNITRCFFTNAICRDLASSYTRQSGIPLGRKVQILKGQLACAAAMLATALLYMLLFILASLSSRSRNNRVLIDQSRVPAQVVRTSGRQSPVQSWKSTNVPVTYEPSQIECPHCGTAIKLATKRR